MIGAEVVALDRSEVIRGSVHRGAGRERVAKIAGFGASRVLRGIALVAERIAR